MLSHKVTPLPARVVGATFRRRFYRHWRVPGVPGRSVMLLRREAQLLIDEGILGDPDSDRDTARYLRSGPVLT